MSLLIKNGTIVTSVDIYNADILCEGEQIVALGRNLQPSDRTEQIDATGMYVFPGMIDPHVHIHLPFMGTSAKDTHATASRAALVGGTTTLIEMICPHRNDPPLDAFNLWAAKAQGNSACDYSFHMGVTRFDDSTETQLRKIVAAGVASLKVFLAYKGAFELEDEELFRTLTLAKQLGVIVTAHTENGTLIDQLQQQLLAQGKTGPEFHETSRPPQVETEGVHHLMTFAEMTGATTYIVHLSCREALAAAMAARDRGVPVFVETLIQFLLLDKTYAERPNFEGSKYVMSPPLRDRRNQEALWNGLKYGQISTVATDHAPFDLDGQKDLGRGDFTKIPNGIPSLEDRINLLFTHAVVPGRLDLTRFVDVASTQAAKIFGLFPQKGTIQLYSDADLVIFDPNYRGTISAKTHSMNVDYSAFEGWPILGRPHVVTVRGKVQVRDGQFVGQQNHGQFLRREPGYN